MLLHCNVLTPNLPTAIGGTCGDCGVSRPQPDTLFAFITAATPLVCRESGPHISQESPHA